MAIGFRLVIGLGLVVVSGCTGTTSEVVPTGHDTFMVASHGVMGHSSGPAQKALALQAANAYCARQGKEIETISATETQASWGKVPSAEIEFRCVAPAGHDKHPN